MIDRGHDLPLVRQAALLRLSRSSLYDEPRPVPAVDLAIMRRIDALHLDDPLTGRVAVPEPRYNTSGPKNDFSIILGRWYRARGWWGGRAPNED